ncbi:hypothetical protein PLESTB_001659400 [Pleodorina starrii]|uniref:Ankyrin repeat domain-containing protein n=1 Tax=Pleodorina starrii TaxID=330485 RepID=A0A9W6C052_9CHLO|nr:hypothetical protein PLESTM_000971900 [Pleodorina starrii]GLC60696.1 hypothetical protein PLESTB_001659400 [Pleodorina starrii]GLC65913.1 hypothetical protein PLESTF_000357600 [Pleodorina starrii]
MATADQQDEASAPAATASPEGAAPASQPSAANVFEMPALVERIASSLSPNEVACTLRLVCKSTAAALDTAAHTTVRLSQSSPHASFVHRWGRPGAMRGLSLPQRQELLRLTARSGSLANLECTLRCCGLRPSESIIAAAANAGQLAACKLLRRLGCPIQKEDVAVAAAAGGSQEVCHWVLNISGILKPYQSTNPNRRTLILDMVATAARRGHVDLLAWLLWHGFIDAPPHLQYNSPRTAVLAGAAWGCDLAFLQQLHNAWVSEPITYPNLEQDPTLVGMPALVDDYDDEIIASAAGSPTPDWAAKVAWLQDVGYAAPSRACELAAARPDAAERLRWLLDERGFALASWHPLEAAAVAGNLPAMELMLQPERRLNVSGLVVNRIAAEGQLGVLQLLHARGCKFDVLMALEEAAARGHLPVVEWLAGLLPATAAAWPAAVAVVAAATDDGGGGGGGLNLEAADAVDAVDPLRRLLATDPWVFAAAAGSGSRVLMEWLLAKGCVWSEAAFVRAAGKGSEGQLQWMVASGCPMGSHGEAYLVADQNGNLAALECLQRLGCPEPPSASSSAAADGQRR